MLRLNAHGAYQIFGFFRGTFNRSITVNYFFMQIRKLSVIYIFIWYFPIFSLLTQIRELPGNDVCADCGASSKCIQCDPENLVIWPHA